MTWLQDCIVGLDRGPMRRFFGRIYSLGVRRVVAALASTPEVHSIYGCGSFFEDRALHGHSDVDLVIVLEPHVKRTFGDHGPVVRRYESIRRWFPFLGRWDEKAGSLIFLEEIETGLPLLESFRVRYKRNKLTRLFGPPLPFEPPSGDPSAGEIVSELHALVRLAASSSRAQGRRLLFWKRLFDKVEALASTLGVAHEYPAELAARLECDDREAFFLRARPSEMLGAMLASVNRTLEAVAKVDGSIAVEVAASEPLPEKLAFPKRLGALVFASGADVERTWTLPSLPLGLRAGLSFFALDEAMPIVELRGSTKLGLSRLARELMKMGEEHDALLALGDGFGFVLSHQLSYVEIVPLDSLAFADVHARLRGEPEARFPSDVYAHERERAEQRLRGMQRMYARHENRIPKAPYPCLYIEEDEIVLREALELLRSYALLRHDLRFHSRKALVDWWRERHPNCCDFLDALEARLDYATGERPELPPCNALYRALHTFMRQALDGADEIEMTPIHERLEISVAIITRNRADDLPLALESLARLARAPDEVIVVDNGSTDPTRAVVERYEDRLPLRYDYLAEPGIPLARNRAVELARGEIIAFTDDDAACEPGWLDAVERAFLRAENVGLVGGWVQHWPRDENTPVDAYYELFHNHKP